ncbi:hypothetical protein [Prosthecobacter sp.]|uniref:hypothetical protein n=1 Tax=Prosthecobacter sp. TaxID=1965333 RepID=UPI0024886C69|nr:hypothetical protein [Prosthecobacter sp.]MDI1310930.1 hypothetical protein [Prosthecobacter sp.]
MARAFGSNQTAAKQWLDEGFSPGDAKAYVYAGCFDIPRTSELRHAGISPLDIARTGLAWDFCSGTISMAEMQRSIIPKVAEREPELLLVES